MTAISELVRSLHSTLSSALPHINIAEGAEERAKGASAMAEAATREYAAAMQRLKHVRAELAEAEADLKSKRHIINDEAARSLLETNRQIAAAQAELGELEAKIRETRKREKEKQNG
jgi:chromosome segregation ATPase